MKTLFCIIVFAIISLISVKLFGQTYKREGDNFYQVKNMPSKAVKTNKVWIEESTKDKYPIYISQTGNAFIKKISKRTGKEYPVYLGSEISKELCKELNIEYKGKDK